MRRRDFLSTVGAVPTALAGYAGQQLASTKPRSGEVGSSQAGMQASGTTVLYDGRAVALTRVTTDAKTNALWVQKSDLPRINDFELKPQGACREDVCIPIPAAMQRGSTFNLTAFAQRVGQRVVTEPASRAWSFAEIPVVRGAYLESRMAPDVAVPDRKGRQVRLSQFRGKKVLLVTWASW